MQPRPNFRIGSSIAVVISLFLLLLILFIGVLILGLWIYPEISLKIVILFTLGIIIVSFESITLTVAANQAVVLLNDFNGKSRGVFEGFFFKLPWEHVQYNIDLEAEIAAEIDEDFSTSDGKMVVKATIVSKVDSGQGLSAEERSRHLLTFVRFELDAVKGMLKARAEEVMRPRLASLSSEGARQANSDDIITESDFIAIQKLISLRIIETPLKQVDYSAEVQKSKDLLSKAIAMGDMVQILISKGYTKAKALELAPLLDKDSKLSKQVVEFQGLKLPPALATQLANLLKK